MSNRWSIVVTVLALVAALRAEARPRTGRIEGTITAVNVAAVPPTVSITRGAATVALKVTAATRIEEPGDPHPSLADLRVGVAAEAEYHPTTLDALRILVQPGAQEGSVRGAVVNATYDSGANTGLVDIDANGDGVRDLVLHTTAQTPIRVGPVALPQAHVGVLIGLPVEAEYDTASFAAFEIDAEVVEGADVEIGGVVIATEVDTAGGGTLTLHTATGALPEFQVVPGTEIYFNGRLVALPAVQIGDRVEIQYLASGTATGATQVALRIAIAPVSPSHTAGTLISVLVAANMLTIQPPNGEPPVTLTVNIDTDLRVDGRRGTLADLAAALTKATAASRQVKVSAQYLTRGGVNLATRVRAKVHGRGRR